MSSNTSAPARKGGDARRKSPRLADAADSPDIRNKIIAGAEDVFARYGLHGATTAMIAAAAGVSKPHIYYYFSSKETLYTAVLEQTLDLWNGAIPPQSGGHQPQSYLKAYIRAKLEFSRTHPRLSRIFANEILNGAPILRARIKTDSTVVLGKLVKQLREWQSAKKIRAIDPSHLVFMIWAMTQYYANGAAELEILLGKRQLDEGDFKAAEKVITQLVFSALGLST